MAMTAHQIQTEETVYYGFKFDVVKIADHLFKVVDQVTHRVREVEHDQLTAIHTAQDMDRRAGWEEFDAD